MGTNEWEKSYSRITRELTCIMYLVQSHQVYNAIYNFEAFIETNVQSIKKKQNKSF